MTIYAIGDIHGHLDKLRSAHDLVEADRAREGAGDAPLIHVGDMIDRGPDSAGVVTYLMDLTARDDRVTVLRGNHDQYLVDFTSETFAMTQHSDSIRWLHPGIGGRETLASYGIKNWRARNAHGAAQNRIPPEHVTFIASLPYTLEAGDCLFVHAGIRPGIPLEDQDPDDLIWIRDEFLWSTRDHGALVVHGHTPVERVEHWGNRLAIDTGAGFGRALSTVAIEGRDAFLLTDEGRQPVPKVGE